MYNFKLYLNINPMNHKLNGRCHHQVNRLDETYRTVGANNFCDV